MDRRTQSRLLGLNKRFYEHFAGSFSSTRHHVQPGVSRLAQQMQTARSILDVGCGNGTLSRALLNCGFGGRYLGVDMSAHLLSKANHLLSEAMSQLDEPERSTFDFRLVDLSEPAWEESIPGVPYDWLVSFAVLHHLPGDSLRQQTVSAFTQLVSPASTLAVSVWQWQNSPRLRTRVLPWSEVGIDLQDVDDGDVLLDWRAGETIGYRYVHTFTEKSLQSLAVAAGFEVVESFYSDGKSGDLALYQVWQLDI